MNTPKEHYRGNLPHFQQLWMHESFETTIRDEQHFVNVVDYTLNNPVKACMIDDWRKWPGSFCEPDSFINNHSNCDLLQP